MITAPHPLLSRPARRPLLLAAALALLLAAAYALPLAARSVPLVRVHIEAAGEEIDASFGEFAGRAPATGCSSQWEGAVAAGEMEMRVMVERAEQENGLTAIANCDN